MFGVKNRKHFMFSIFFVLLGLFLLATTYIEHGPSTKGQFGYIAGAIALTYGLIRSRIIVKQ